MDPRLIDIVAWINVELQSNKPDMQRLKEASEFALLLASKTQINHKTLFDKHIKMSEIWGRE